MPQNRVLYHRQTGAQVFSVLGAADALSNDPENWSETPYEGMTAVPDSMVPQPESLFAAKREFLRAKPKEKKRKTRRRG